MNHDHFYDFHDKNQQVGPIKKTFSSRVGYSTVRGVLAGKYRLGKVISRGGNIMMGGILINDIMCYRVFFQTKREICCGRHISAICCGQHISAMQAQKPNTCLEKIFELLKVNMIFLEIFHHHHSEFKEFRTSKMAFCIRILVISSFIL